MMKSRLLLPLVALGLAACGGGDEGAEAAAAADTVTTPEPAAAAPPGSVDTAGVGTSPPTAP